MKKLIWIVSLSCFWIGGAWGQQVTSKAGQKKVAKPVAAGTKKSKTDKKDTSYSLISQSSNRALASMNVGRLTISDPTVQTFNSRVLTRVTPEDQQAILGLPKIRTGIAHGRLLFYPTSSATFGTSTGSGTVGTGSSLGNGGMSGAVIGVNGKSPYASPGMYGTRVLSDLRPKENLEKPSSKKGE